MVASNPGFLVEHKLNCASSPHMFMTTFGENHVWKQAGERETENEF
jgi:hypothetical protein